MVTTASFRRVLMILHLSTSQLMVELFFYMPITLAMALSTFAIVKAHHSGFLMSNLGPLRYFLGIEVSSTSNGFFIKSVITCDFPALFIT